MSDVGLHDTDSEDELPPGWEERIHSDGRVYFADHSTQSTHWAHPVSGRRKVVPTELPYGWTCREEDDGSGFVFVEESTGKITSTDPRLAFARTAKQSLYDFKQRFDAASTALQVLRGVDLTSRKALITGANCGIGYETCKSLAMHGCEVILACRDELKAEAAITQIKTEVPTAQCQFIQLDLNSLHSVKNFANEVKLKFTTIDILILNAGIFGESFTLSEDNFERTFQVNHLAQFYLTLLLKPLLTARSNSRILILASESHRFAMLSRDNISKEYLSPQTSKYFTAFMAYNESKLCNVLIASEINRRWSIYGVTCNSIHPGNLVSTQISRSWWIYRLLFSLVRPFTKSLQQAAATTVWGATALELNGVSGQYFNNCWLCKPSEKAEDIELARSLWNLSVTMIESVMGPIAISEKPIETTLSDESTVAERGDGDLTKQK